MDIKGFKSRDGSVHQYDYESLANIPENGTVTDQQIAAAVEKYLTENPVGGVTDQQIYDAVTEYLTENPVEGVTDEQIAQAVADYLVKNPIEGTGTVKSVNGVEPDKNGNVEITIPDSSENGNQGGGMNATASALLINILRNAMYTADQSASITALESALASGDSGGTDEPDTPVEPGVTYYTIVNVLTGVTNSNNVSSVTKGASYTATLTAADGFNMSAVTVTMGGVDVTADVYADGTITIESVTGAVIITASASEDSATAPAFQLTSPLVLGDTTDPRINDTAKCRIATGETVNDDEDWTICIDFTSLEGASCVNDSIVVNGNNQVKAYYGTPNWYAAFHSVGGGAIQNEFASGKYKGLNWIAIMVHNAATKTFSVYGTTEHTATYETIATASDGQIYVGRADAIGTINRFAIYKRVLSADEITEWIGG